MILLESTLLLIGKILRNAELHVSLLVRMTEPFRLEGFS